MGQYSYYQNALCNVNKEDIIENPEINSLIDLLIITKQEKINADLYKCRADAISVPKSISYTQEKGNYEELIKVIEEYYKLKQSVILKEYAEMEQIPKLQLIKGIETAKGLCLIVQSLLQREKDQAQWIYENFIMLVDVLNSSAREISSMTEIISTVTPKPFNQLSIPDLENDCVSNYLLKGCPFENAKNELVFKTVIDSSTIEDLRNSIVKIKEDNIAKFKQCEIMQSSSIFIERLHMYEDRAKEKERDFRKAYDKVKSEVFVIGADKFGKCSYNTNTLYADLILNEGRVIKKLIESKQVEQSWMSKLPKTSSKS
jgi:hypothetical protein